MTNFKIRDNIILPLVCLFKVESIMVASTRKCSKQKHITRFVGVEKINWISICIFFFFVIHCLLSWKIIFRKTYMLCSLRSITNISLSCRANKEASHLLAWTRLVLLRCNWSCKGHIFGIEITVLSLTCVAWTRDASHNPRVLQKPLLFITLALWAMTSTNA